MVNPGEIKFVGVHRFDHLPEALSQSRPVENATPVTNLLLAAGDPVTSNWVTGLAVANTFAVCVSLFFPTNVLC